MADVAEGGAGSLGLRPDQIGIDLELRLGMGLAIAGDAFRTRQQCRASGEQGNAAMAEADQIARDLKAAATMVGQSIGAVTRRTTCQSSAPRS